MSGDEPKIFVDESWKSQVQREKEEAAKKAVAEPAEETAEAPGDDELEESPFNMLVGTLATQAMYALGLVAPEGVEQVQVDLQHAQISILFLKSLQEKTAGNLSEDEQANLDSATTELEGALMARIQQFRDHAMKEAGIDPGNLKPQG